MFYLDRFVGSGTDDEPFITAAQAENPACSAIGLRPDPTAVDGAALVHSPTTLPNRTGRVALTDNADEATSTLRQRLEQRLGVTLSSGFSFRQLVAELLMAHGDDTRADRWNRLRPAGHRWEIWLGGLLYEQVHVAGGATQTDNFDRADSSTLGGSWTEVGADLQISSNLLRLVTSGTTGLARWDADLDSSNTYCQVAGNYAFSQTATKALAPLVRYSTLAATYYRMQRTFTDSASTATLSLTSVVAGTPTDIAGPNTDTAVSGEVLKVSADGSTVKGYKNGAEVFSVTDVTIATGVRCGVRLLSGNSTLRCRADNWEAGDVIARSLVYPPRFRYPILMR